MNNKKKILIFIDWYLPGYRAGGPIRSVANLINRLKEKFEFSVVTTDTDYKANTSYSGIIPDQWQDAPDGTRTLYLSRQNISPGKIRNILKNESYDLIYLNSFFSWYFSIIPLLFAPQKKKKVLAPRGMLAEGALSVKPFKKRLYLLLFGLFKLQKRFTFHATSLMEKRNIQDLFGDNIKIKIASNCIPPPVQKPEPFILKKSGEISLIQVARISPEKNQLDAIRFLTDLKGLIKLDIYGQLADKKYWHKCEKEIKNLDKNIQVNYKGDVRHDKIRDLFSAYHYFYLPTKGENFGHSIFEALSTGCPVIISDQTIWKDLERSGAGWTIPLKDHEKYNKVLNSALLSEQQEYNESRSNVLRYAIEYYNKTDPIKDYQGLFNI